jgi:hypothetical protein
MRAFNEIFRLLAITLVSPAIGFGTLFFLDAMRIATPQNVDKGVFVLFGFIVAIVTALWLFRAWPSQYSRKPLAQEPSPEDTLDDSK